MEDMLLKEKSCCNDSNAEPSKVEEFSLDENRLYAYMSCSEAATYLNRSLTSVRNYVKNGLIEHKIIDGQILLLRESVEFIKERFVQEDFSMQNISLFLSKQRNVDTILSFYNRILFETEVKTADVYLSLIKFELLKNTKWVSYFAEIFIKKYIDEDEFQILEMIYNGVSFTEMLDKLNIRKEELYTKISIMNEKLNNISLDKERDRLLELDRKADEIERSYDLLSTEMNNVNCVNEKESLVTQETGENENSSFQSVLLDSLKLSARTANCMKNARIKTVFDLSQHSEDEILSIRNIGKKSYNELKEILNKYGLTFIEDADKKDNSSKIEKIDENGEDNSMLRTIKLNSLNLSTRTANSMKNARIKTVFDLAQYSEKELMSIKNIGKKSYAELKDVLNEYGLVFK